MSGDHAEPGHAMAVIRKAARRAFQAIAAVFILLSIAVAAVAILLSTQAGSRWVLEQALQRANTETIDIRHDAIQGSLLGGLTVQGLDVRLEENRIQAQSVELVWRPASVLGGTLVVNRIHAAGLTVDWQTAPGDGNAPAGTPPGEILESLLPLPVDIQLTQISADGMQLMLDGTALPPESFRFGVTLRNRQLEITDLDLQAPPARVSGSIALALTGDYELDTSFDWEYRTEGAELPPLSGRLNARGDLNTLQIGHNLQEPAQVTTEGSVTAGLADILNGADVPLPVALDLQHTATSLDLDDTGLSIAALSGWQIDTLNLNTSGSPDDLTVDGNMQIQAILPGGDGSTPFAMAMRWSSAIQGSTLHLDQLQVEAQGNELQLDGLLDWSAPLTLNADLILDAPDPAAFYPLPGGLELLALQTQAAVRLTMPESGLSGEVLLDGLTAELNGQALSGGGRLAIGNSMLQVEALQIRSGENVLQASGMIGETLDATVNINIPDLGGLYPPANGTASAELVLSGTMDSLSASARARASGLVMEGLELDTLQLDGSVEADRVDANLTVEGLTAASQQVEQMTARVAGSLSDHTVSLRAQGSPGNLEIDVTGGLQNGRWEGRLENSVVVSGLGRWQQENPADLVASAADNSLARTCWQQQAARLCTAFSLSGGQLDGAVDLQEYPLGVLNHAEAGQILRDFHDGRLPASHTTPPDDTTIPFTLPQALALVGTLDASATVSGPLTDMQALQLDAGATLNDLALYLRRSGEPLPVEGTADMEEQEEDAAVEQILWEQATAAVSLAGGDWTGESSMVIYQEELAGSGVAMRGSADASATLSRDGNLQGSADIGFDEVAWIEALVPQLRNPTGRLRGTVSVGGQLDAPALGAELSLQEARTEVPALGLLLEDINLRLENPQDERFTLTGRLRSGEGSLQLESEILRPLDDNRSLTLTIQGENVELVSLPDLQASLSPDLTLEGGLDGLTLNGRLNVPMLDATVNELPESAVDVSADTIITTDSPGVRNAAVTERGILQDTPISGDVRVSLGDQVHFSGFGLDTDLTGSLDITLRPDATPLTYGELEVVNGRFETYGQTLRIEQGKLQFLGSYNNPALDIRAVRQVGNTRVGVQMNGTLLNIRSQLFSTPALPDADVLAMLITGRPLSEAGEQESPSLVGAVARLGINQGQGLTDQVRSRLGLDTLALDAGSGSDLQDSSLTLGKYLTPRIFVRYAVGLFDTENTLAIDYTLTDSLKLEAQSGKAQSLDLIYQMER